MIRLQRPAIPPALARKAPNATRKLWDAWRKGGEMPKANAAVYADPAVKRTLCAAQHDKCAFCETINPSSHEVVEHYRPKDGWRQSRGDALQKPQYFWLAYAWENLLFVCDVCNDRAHKENLFPLANPVFRATPDEPDTAGEDPLLINPYGPRDPEDHIDWNSDVPVVRNGSPRGRATIEVLGLDRDGMRADFRRAHLSETEVSLARLERLPKNDPLRVEMRSAFPKFLGDDAPWAAMIRANLGDRIRAL